MLKVRTPRGTSESFASSFVVKSLDALWDDDSQQYGVKLTQTGRSCRGRTVFRIRNLTGATTGSVNGDLQVTSSTDYFPGVSDSFVGRLDSSPHCTSERLTSGRLTLRVFGVPFGDHMSFVRK